MSGDTLCLIVIKTVPSEAAPRLPVLLASDLIGCRYRLSQDFLAAPTQGQLLAGHTVDTASRLPTRLAAIPNLYTVAAGPDADLDTLEAIARGEEVIAGAVLTHRRPGPQGHFAGLAEVSQPDLLVKIDDAPHSPTPTYMPVLVLSRRLLSSRPMSPRALRASISAGNGARLLPLSRLGRQGVMGRTVRQALSEVVERKLRHHGPDAVAVGQAAAMLHRLGVSSGLVGAISSQGTGIDVSNIVVVAEGSRVASYRSALRDARDTIAATMGMDSRFSLGTWPLAPRRIRECKSCRHFSSCNLELEAADDISLLLPGDKAVLLRKAGINTVLELARATEGQAGVSRENIWLARARKSGAVALRTQQRTWAPRADIEMDIDMEAYPLAGAYLWGTWVPGEDYCGFATWQPPGKEGLGGAAEARNFALFWDYLRRRRLAAASAGQSFRAYCWAAEGENYWLTSSAKRFGGLEFEVSASDYPLGAHLGGVSDGASWTVAVPELAEVEEFIRSEEWVDMLKITRRQILSPQGLGLKVVAPWTGFRWRDAQVNGQASLDLYRIATATDLEQLDDASFAGLGVTAAKEMLLRYNGDDCRSVASVRDWLDSQQAVADIAHGKALPRP